MNEELYGDILKQGGFCCIGRLCYRLHVSVWWNAAPDRRMQVILLTVGNSTLLKGDKSYYLQSVGPEGETWARDIGLLQDYLESHFPELRISFSHFRDVPPRVAESEARRRMVLDAPTQVGPTVEQVARLQRELMAREQQQRSKQALLALAGGGEDLLGTFARQQAQTETQQIDQLRAEVDKQQQRLGLLHHLQREYQAKGSAAAYVFTISSNLQVAHGSQQFRDVLGSVVKELVDLHRYEITQKLGGRMNIQVAEAGEPALVWIEQWLGGGLSPRQLEKLGPEFGLLRQAADAHTMVVPDEDIVTDGAVRHAGKALGARVVSTVMQRLDRTGDERLRAASDPAAIPPSALPIHLGQRLDDTSRPAGPAVVPLGHTIHIYISGTTGSGKSYLNRVLVEGAAEFPRLNILVLDPRNQAVGLLVGEDRPEVLKMYGDFGMKTGDAHGFEFAYYAPATRWAAELPRELSALATGRSVVSFKGLDDRHRCQQLAQILESVFSACAAEESEHVRLLIVVDEAQTFTRKRVDESAKSEGERAERALDRIAREGRKYGICMVLVSQSIKDFAYESASIRANTNTKVFLRNSDREIAYAADFLDDARQLVELPTGVALVHNAAWGVLRVRVRPPYSKVYEFNEADCRRIAGREKDPAVGVSADAQRLLSVIRMNSPLGGPPLNLTKLAGLAGLTSKRRLLELVDELERSGGIRTRQLRERGQPRVIEWAGISSGVDETADKSRTQPDTKPDQIAGGGSRLP